LGSQLVGRLLEEKANVITIERDRIGKSRVCQNGIWEKVSTAYGDVVDFEFVERVVAKYKVDTIFHLAAQAIASVGRSSPLSTFNTNIKGTWNVLESARRHKETVRSVVIPSSETSYGRQLHSPYDESTPLRAHSPYAVSKTCADLLARTYYHTYDLPVSVARCSAIFGPGDLNFSRLIPGTILSFLKGEAPVVRGNGRSVRGFLYIKDAVDALFSIAEQADKSAGQAFNLAGEEHFSVLEIIQLIGELLGSDLQPVVKNEVRDEIAEQYMSIDKIRMALGWRPKYSIREALRETIAWYSEKFPVSAVRGPSPFVHLTTGFSHIPVVIFCGGSGTRLREETHNKPKPMVDVGGKPLLWHVMKIYHHYGFRKFILTLGYKGEYITNYFRNGGDGSFSDCEIIPVDTGDRTPTGGRLLRSSSFIDNEIFMCTYGDGVSDLDVTKVLETHRRLGDVSGTITSVRVPHKFGIISFDGNGKLNSYQKGHLMNEPINAGFMVFDKTFLNYLDDSMMIEEPFNRLAREHRLGVHYHDGYFFAVDTYRDLEELNEAWANNPPWKVWAG